MAKILDPEKYCLWCFLEKPGSFFFLLGGSPGKVHKPFEGRYSADLFIRWNIYIIKYSEGKV